MQLKIKQIILLFLLFTVSLIMWYVYPQGSNKIFYQNYRYLSQIRKSGPYIIKRLTSADLDYVPCLLLGNKVDEDAIYLDPEGNSIWYLSIANASEDVLYSVSSWLQIDFEGNTIRRLSENQQPPSGGIFLKDKLQVEDADWDDSDDRLRVVHFKRNHFNWSILNPLEIYGSTDPRYKPKWYWDGIAYLRLNLPDGAIDFKTETSNKESGYNFEAKLFEVPTAFSKNQAMILTLANTEALKGDKGIYFIYKK